jgi:hypothetical protein
MTMLSNPPAPPSMLPGMLPPAAMTKVSLLLGEPCRFVKPLNARPPTVPPPAPVMFQVVSDDGPTIVWPESPAATPEAFVKDTFAGPLTLPDVPFTDHVAPAPFTSRAPPAAS